MNFLFPRGNEDKEKEEVDMLRKEVEEMKFMQELEQSDYKQMKEKLQTYEKDMKDTKHDGKDGKSPKKPLSNTGIGSEVDGDTVELLLIKPTTFRAKKSMSPESIEKRIKERDAHIKLLKNKLEEKVTTTKLSENKLKTLAKEYEKRLNTMESLKDEEIEDLKEQYKEMMEDLALQIVKSKDRTKEEEEKNSKLLSILNEMRQDMGMREEELERKILMQESRMRKSDLKLTKAEIKLGRTGTKYSSAKTELTDAVKLNAEYAQKLKTMEEDFENVMAELKAAHEKDKETIDTSVHEEIAALTGKLVEMEKLFDEEAAEHDKTASKVRDLDIELNAKNEETKTLLEKIGMLQKEIIEMRQKTKTFDELQESLTGAEKEIAVLNEDKMKKRDVSKKYIEEITELKGKMEKMSHTYSKELKMKDIEFVKAKKKWSLSEEKFKQIIDELKMEQENISSVLQSVNDCNMAEAALQDKQKIQNQEKIIEQLKADKANMQLAFATLEGRKQQSTRSLGSKNSRNDAGIIESRDNEEGEKASTVPEQSQDTSKVSTTEVNVEKKQGIMAGKSYRDYVRNKKFTKKSQASERLEV